MKEMLYDYKKLIYFTIKYKYIDLYTYVHTSAKKPYCPSILVLTISTNCILLFDVMAVTRVLDLSLQIKK